MVRRSARVIALLLVFGFLGSPAFALEDEPGFLARLWQAFQELVLPLDKLGAGLDPAGTPEAEEQTGTPGDLGAGLDPAGRT